MGPIIGGVGEQNAPCNPARSPAARTAADVRATLLSLRRSRPPPNTVGALLVAALVGVGVYFKMKAKKPPTSAGEGQAQGSGAASKIDIRLEKI